MPNALLTLEGCQPASDVDLDFYTAPGKMETGPTTPAQA